MNELVQVNYNGEIVITTKMLADVYETEEIRIQQNFNSNQEKFKEGKHYYKLQGNDLKEFKTVLVKNEDPLYQEIKFASVLILWTKRGASRHCKMLGTDKAWDMFDVLEENYFNPKIPQISEKQQCILTIYEGGENAVVASKRLTEIEVEEATAPLKETIKELQPKSEAYDKWINSKIKYTVSDLAHCVIGLDADKAGGHQINTILVEYGVLYENPAWRNATPKQRQCMLHYSIHTDYYGQGYAYKYVGEDNSSGYTKKYCVLKSSPKGVDLIFNILEELEYIVDRNTLCDDMNN